MNNPPKNLDEFQTDLIKALIGLKRLIEDFIFDLEPRTLEYSARWERDKPVEPCEECGEKLEHTQECPNNPDNKNEI